jgi:hypothetical protein
MKVVKNLCCLPVAILDKGNSTHVIGSSFLDTLFFTESKRFDRYLKKCRGGKREKADYVSV